MKRHTFLLILLIVKVNVLPAQVTARFDSLFNTLYKQGNFNGCVLVAVKGKPVYERALGYANFAKHQPLTNTTMFELASVSKQFTSMAIMQLHQAKKLRYNDNLTKYFPQLHYHGITISNLLHHTSGLQDFADLDKQLVNVNRINYNQDILSTLIKHNPSLLFKPGEHFNYSNTNYVLLALIIEKLSGTSFSSYMDKNIFRPLGMSNTKVYAQRAEKHQIKNYAYGFVYNPRNGGFIINDSLAANSDQYHFDGISGPYGISSTTEDMLKWDQALYTDKLVSKKEQDSAYAPSKLNDHTIAAMDGFTYGFGWLISPEDEHTGKTYFHTGGLIGYESILIRYPEKNKTIIILTNTWNTVNILQLASAMENILFNQPFSLSQAIHLIGQPLQKMVALTPAQLKAVDGTYSFTKIPNRTITLTSDCKQVYSQVSGQVKVELYPESEFDFFYTIVDAHIKFLKDSSGFVRKLTLYQNGEQLEAIKE